MGNHLDAEPSWKKPLNEMSTRLMSRRIPTLPAAIQTLSSLMILLVVTVFAACGGEGAARTVFLSLGTAGTGGIYYPLGGALASRMSMRDSVRQITAEVTGGSVENINRLAAGQMDLAMALPITMYEAYHGGDAFPTPVLDLRVVAPLYPNLTQVMVAAGNDAQSVADFRGQRVAVGPPGSGTEQIARQTLEAYGLTYDDIEERFLSFAEASAALKDRAIDAAIISVGYPAAAVLDAMTTGGVRLLPLDESVRTQLLDSYSYYSPGVIPAGAYPGVDQDIPTLAQINWIIALESLDDEVVLLVLDILANELEFLIRVHPQANQIDISSLEKAPIPLHPAAATWLANRR